MRDELDRRPLVVAFLGLCCGLAAVFAFWHIVFVVPVLLVASRWSMRALALVAAAVGFLIYPRLDSEPVVEQSFMEAEVDVIAMPQTVGSGLRTVVQHGRTRYILYLPESADVVLGDRILVRANVLPLREGQVARRGAVGALHAISAPKPVEDGSVVWRAGLAVRKSFHRMTSRFANERTGALLDGLCFSMTSELPPDFRDAMSRTGTSHIVATSGLHIVLATFALAMLLGTMPIPRPVQLLLLVLLLSIYAAAAGFRPPVMRAVLMAAVVMTAYVWRRAPDGLSCLAFAGVLSLVWAPEMIADVGFQLSMVAVAGLVLFSRLPEDGPRQLWPTVKRWVGRYAQASLVTALATAPLLAYHFGLVPLVSVPANVLVVPILALVIGGALASWGLYLTLTAVGVGILKIVVEPLTGWIGAVIEALARLPFASVAIAEFSPYWLVPAYVLALLAWRPYVRSP
ncbi:MAG: ComEC/Rec2 family competence protein [Armatimonadetes bacterium]|nr:ComEC/Rec2 family competence protein [Armatimonadota bacterium]